MLFSVQLRVLEVDVERLIAASDGADFGPLAANARSATRVVGLYDDCGVVGAVIVYFYDVWANSAARLNVGDSLRLDYPPAWTFRLSPQREQIQTCGRKTRPSCICAAEWQLYPDRPAAKAFGHFGIVETSQDGFRWTILGPEAPDDGPEPAGAAQSTPIFDARRPRPPSFEAAQGASFEAAASTPPPPANRSSPTLTSIDLTSASHAGHDAAQRRRARNVEPRDEPLFSPEPARGAARGSARGAAAHGAPAATTAAATRAAADDARRLEFELVVSRRVETAERLFEDRRDDRRDAERRGARRKRGREAAESPRDAGGDGRRKRRVAAEPGGVADALGAAVGDVVNVLALVVEVEVLDASHHDTGARLCARSIRWPAPRGDAFRA
ncbi:hypothetical protein M885DRAFT_199550 [Pelagophyceae sp. CCMP2097]|nr:hypothetical protein M885DRAFT_199550 [Pelagophyceae sp. CCMP2097]